MRRTDFVSHLLGLLLFLGTSFARANDFSCSRFGQWVIKASQSRPAKILYRSVADFRVEDRPDTRLFHFLQETAAPDDNGLYGKILDYGVALPDTLLQRYIVQPASRAAYGKEYDMPFFGLVGLDHWAYEGALQSVIRKLSRGKISPDQQLNLPIVPRLMIDYFVYMGYAQFYSFLDRCHDLPNVDVPLVADFGATEKNEGVTRQGELCDKNYWENLLREDHRFLGLREKYQKEGLTEELWRLAYFVREEWINADELSQNFLGEKFQRLSPEKQRAFVHHQLSSNFQFADIAMVYASKQVSEAEMLKLFKSRMTSISLQHAAHGLVLPAKTEGSAFFEKRPDLKKILESTKLSHIAPVQKLMKELEAGSRSPEATLAELKTIIIKADAYTFKGIVKMPTLESAKKSEN